MKTPLFYLLFTTTTIFGQVVNLNSSLTACYALDGSAAEPINNLNGTLSSVTSTVNRFGTANSAYSFSGNSSSYIALPNNALIKPTEISVSCWVQLYNVSNPQVLIFTHNGCQSYHEGYQLGFAYTNNSNGFHITRADGACLNIGQTVLTTTNNTPVLANTWYHIGFYVGADSLKLYINGAMVGSLANYAPIVYTQNTQVYLGGTNLQFFNLPFSGSMDNLRFYNRKLTGAEMYQLYLTDPECKGGTAPVASFSLSRSQACLNVPIVLTDGSSNIPSAWSWQLPGSTPSVSTVSNPTVSYTTPGVYSIYLTSYNNFGQSNTVIKTVTISACTSIRNEEAERFFAIYPNPSAGEFVLSSASQQAIEFSIYDLLGNLIMRDVTTSKLSVDLRNYPSGIYFARVKSGGSYFVEKLIKD